MKKKFNIVLIILALIFIFTAEKLSAQMFWNQACSFAGNANSYIARVTATDLEFTGNFTLEAWINPSNANATQTIIQKSEGNNPNGYGMYLINGKVAMRTNGITRVIGKNVVPANTWTHIVGRYIQSMNSFSILVNGTGDTNAIVPGSIPIATSDSLFIGKGFDPPFQGQMDEVRIWKNFVNQGNISQFRRTSLGTNTGVYKDLVLSLTFQERNSDGVDFTLFDQSGNSYHCINKGVTAVDLSNRPSTTINYNDGVDLNGANEYLAAPDVPALNPFVVMTLEAWIYPRTAGMDKILIHKGSDNGASIDYSLRLHEGKLKAIIDNQVVLLSDTDIPLKKWSHVAFTYDGNNDINSFYINGKLTDDGTNNTSIINNGTDSLYIGGTMGLPDFDGYMDEVRISSICKTAEELNSRLFTSIDEANDLPATEVIFNLDGYTESSTGSLVRLHFRNEGNFSHAGSYFNVPMSPILRSDGLNFHEGFNLKTSDKRIPASGSMGNILDTLDISWNETISDINIFVALNHNDEENLSIILTSPSGVSVTLQEFNSLTGEADNIVTIYDDQADSTIVNSRYVSFGPAIKPKDNLNSVFDGNNTSGEWILSIIDAAVSDTGRLYGWGIQVNNKTSVSKTLSAFSIMQGFYNPVTDIMTQDTMRCYLRNFMPPYNIVDSSKRRLLVSGFGGFTFTNASKGVPYYLQLKHRNSIETWSSAPVIFDPLNPQSEYSFITSAPQAFGNNMVQIDADPVRFGIYGGDVNQDGVIDGADAAFVDNDASNFASGYIVTDVTGDGIVDGSDAAITDNNAFNFVGKIIP